MKVIVYHRSYGCDTGCCGHAVAQVPDDFELDEYDRKYGGVWPDGELRGSFKFDHPYDEDYKAFAEDMLRSELGEEHIKDLDWDNCIIMDDW